MTSSKHTRLFLTLAGVLQGFAIYLLSEGDWDAQVRILMTGCVFSVVAGLTVQLTYGIGATVRALLASIVLGLVVAGLWYGLDLRVQFHPQPEQARVFDDHVPLFLLSVTIAVYILLPYLQTWLEAGRWRFPYASLFQYSWNNILVLFIAGIFLGIFWLVLLLWWELFNLVGVGFFEDLFTGSFFAWVFSGGVLGLGIAIARENPRIVPTLRRVMLMLFQVLAPVLAVASILFLLFLPFTGLEPLWNTGAATGVLVSLMFALVLVVNAVVQDGQQEETTFGPWRNKLMAVALVLLPVFAGLAFYATWLRIDQYGLTPERFIAKLIVLVAAVQVLAYAFGVIRYRGGWARFIYRANPVIALVVAGAALLLNTPLLDPYSRSASNQLARLVDEQVDVEDFDFASLQFKLGQPGRDALTVLQSGIDGHPQQAMIDERVDEITQATSYWNLRALTPDRVAIQDSDLIVRPEGHSLPHGLVAALNQHFYGLQGYCAAQGHIECGVLLIDINRDGRDEALFFTSQPHFLPWVFYWDEGRETWVQGQMLRHQFGKSYPGREFWQDFINGEYELVEPNTYDIRFGDDVFRF